MDSGLNYINLATGKKLIQNKCIDSYYMDADAIFDAKYDSALNRVITIN
jgi:hypothetical protein